MGVGPVLGEAPRRRCFELEDVQPEIDARLKSDLLRAGGEDLEVGCHLAEEAAQAV